MTTHNDDQQLPDDPDTRAEADTEAEVQACSLDAMLNGGECEACQ